MDEEAFKSKEPGTDGDAAVPAEPSASALPAADEKCERERREYLEGWQRAKADLINYKRDESKRQNEWRERLENEVIATFLPALDTFDLALEEVMRLNLPEEHWRGLTLVRAQFLEALKQCGVVPFDSRGAAFDPARHEALEEIDRAGSSGMVIEEVKKGYLRHDYVLRPASVKVSK